MFEENPPCRLCGEETKTFTSVDGTAAVVCERCGHREERTSSPTAAPPRRARAEQALAVVSRVLLRCHRDGASVRLKLEEREALERFLEVV